LASSLASLSTAVAAKSDAARAAKARLAARSALVTMAAWHGWDDADVVAGVARLRAVDPAEHVDPP
jgi:hypothetical protein